MDRDTVWTDAMTLLAERVAMLIMPEWASDIGETSALSLQGDAPSLNVSFWISSAFAGLTLEAKIVLLGQEALNTFMLKVVQTKIDNDYLAELDDARHEATFPLIDGH